MRRLFGRLRPGNPSNRLGLRMVAVITIAILPIGLISVYQTNKVIEERRALSKTALLEEMQETVSRSREAISSALATAEVLATVADDLRVLGGRCALLLQAIVEETPILLFAGLIDDQLELVCSSRGARRNVSDLQVIRPDLTGGRIEILMRPLELLGGSSAVNVTVPIIENGRRTGTVWVAVPLYTLSRMLSQSSTQADVLLFQSEGEILASDALELDPNLILPASTSLAELVGQNRRTFRDRNRAGHVRDFAVVSLIEGQVYALGSWDPNSSEAAARGYEEALALYFPFIMWAVAVGVTYVGVHRLVIRHVARLVRWMRLYSEGYEIGETARLDGAPEELEIVALAFRDMSQRLTEQEKAREEDLKEKSILLREVHHRVKNNLQIMSSVINMQTRTANSAEAKRLLQRVQDRILALSTVYRHLYEARKQSAVGANRLLDGIVRQVSAVGAIDDNGRPIEITSDFAEIEINPDQSVPLSLLANEALLNAVKYCGAPAGQKGWIRVSLEKTGKRSALFRIANSLAAAKKTDDETWEAGSGLGSQLIESFVSQLDGRMDVIESEGSYTLEVRFRIAPPDLSPEDV